MVKIMVNIVTIVIILLLLCVDIAQELHKYKVTETPAQTRSHDFNFSSPS